MNTMTSMASLSALLVALVACQRAPSREIDSASESDIAWAAVASIPLDSLCVSSGRPCHGMQIDSVVRSMRRAVTSNLDSAIARLGSATAVQELLPAFARTPSLTSYDRMGARGDTLSITVSIATPRLSSMIYEESVLSEIERRLGSEPTLVIVTAFPPGAQRVVMFHCLMVRVGSAWHVARRDALEQ